MMNLTAKDREQLVEKGISERKVQDQINTFKEGIPFVNLKNAAIVGNGIYKFSKTEEKELVELFEKRLPELSILKFVPASGAASRMFKALFNFLETYNPEKESLGTYLERTNDKEMRIFADGLEKFPFHENVIKGLEQDYDSKGKKVYDFVNELLDENALNYGFYPKGLLPFHKYPSGSETPFQEHLKEGALYASSKGKSNLHFTISEQHEAMFNFELNEVREKVSQDTNTEFHVDYSFQKPSTDTIAVDMDNEPFRNLDGSLLFRPGGHGALIENLNEQDADIIFIKNIDNVAITKDADAVAESKKVLGGVLLQVQDKAFSYAKILEDDSNTEADLSEIEDFLKERLNVRFNSSYAQSSKEAKIKILKDRLNRPIRICGMVKNEGEPGGGPFWITDSESNVSLQIIESAQIDMDNKEQVEILQNSTHFNPVDLVCGVRNYKGEKYDLLDFVDKKQGFITGKTKEGRDLKALELPGLWNGAMAYWNTIFVEVPLVTFNPVKTVNDLLKPSHQA